MKYRSPRIDGRFANILYGLLNNYINSKIDNENYIYVGHKCFTTNFLSTQIINDFSLNNIYISNENGEIKNTDIQIIENKAHPYFNYFDEDFTENDLNDFIKETFLKLDLFKKDLITDTAALHIRGGDYYHIPHFRNVFSFNFEKYLNEALSICKDKGISKLDIFSDEIEYAKFFLNIIEKFNFEITFKENSTHTSDFVNMSLYKNKILWNSTFSYWTAYISNVIFENNYTDIIVPEKLVAVYNNGFSMALNKKWTIIRDI